MLLIIGLQSVSIWHMHTVYATYIWRIYFLEAVRISADMVEIKFKKKKKIILSFLATKADHHQQLFGCPGLLKRLWSVRIYFVCQTHKEIPPPLMVQVSLTLASGNHGSLLAETQQKGACWWTAAEIQKTYKNGRYSHNILYKILATTCQLDETFPLHTHTAECIHQQPETAARSNTARMPYQLMLFSLQRYFSWSNSADLV